MRIKDIEKSLKKEHDSSSVPDVLKRAQKAPINRLLDGQRPLRAFDKNTAVRVLWTVLALALAALICLGTLGIMGGGDKAVLRCNYLHIRVENGDESVEFGIVVGEDDGVVLCVKEKENGVFVGQNLNKGGYTLQNAINDVYRSNTGDKVYVCAVGRGDLTELAQLVEEIVGGSGNTVVMLSQNDESVLASLKESTQSDSNDASELVDAYLARYGA